MKWIFFIVMAILAPSVCIGIESNATVERVVDGDTVIINLDGVSERIRIVGIDTPEIVASNRPVECFGKEASDHAKSVLRRDDSVYLIHDNERDKYDRRLGYIRLSDTRDFGYIMISEGYAYAYRSFPHERMRTYVNAERDARTNKKGLWADDACRDAEQSVEVISSVWQSYIEIFFKWMRLFFNIF